MQHFYLTYTEGVVAGSFALRNIMSPVKRRLKVPKFFCILSTCAGQQHGGLRFAWGSHLIGSFPLPCPSSLPFPHHHHNTPTPTPAAQRCLLIVIDVSCLNELFFFPPTLSSSSFRSNELVLMWADAVLMWPTFCLSVFGLWCFIRSLCVFFCFCPQIPIISADHLSSHKYLTQM